MNNAELVKALRCDGTCRDECPYSNGREWCDEERMIKDAADALEAADKRIARLEEDLRNSTISNPERFKIYGYTVKDLILFADMCKRNDVQEADLNQAAWNLEFAVRAVANERMEIIKNTMDEIKLRFTPDFEKAYEEMMPNCGTRMKGEHDGNAV
jgi:hypothetical protein